MNSQPPNLKVTIAQTGADLIAAQRLRYAVFVDELGGGGAMVDHAAQLEMDRFDPHTTHFLLHDLHRPAADQVVGVYRVMTQDGANAAGQFYCDDEFDLTLLRRSGKRLLELGRSCLHADYRGGAGMMYLWSALSDFVAQQGIELMFGVASFHGTNVDAVAGPLSVLHAKHLAPPSLRVIPKPPNGSAMDRTSIDSVNRVAAMRDTPALIKAYLRLGGFVGDGAFVDHSFNTIDICLILPTDAVGQLQRRLLARGSQLG